MAHPTPTPALQGSPSAPGPSHALPEAPHEFHHSWAPLIVASGITLLVVGALYPKVALPLGLAVALVGLAWWIREDVARWHWVVSTGVKDPRPSPFWGMVLFIGSEVLIFGSLFALWFVGKHHAGAQGRLWGEEVEGGLPLVPTFLNTVVLVSSGATLHWGMLRLRKGDRRGYLLGLFLTLLLGAVFLGGQVREYLTLITREDFTIRSNLFGGIFFGLTGTHGTHVLGGLVFLFIVFLRSLGKTQTKDHHMALETAAFYWHFVDVVWIFLFAVVYMGLF